MTKADLIEEVSRVVEMTRKESEVIVEAIFDSIVRSLRTGDKIEIRGFGSFRTRQRQPRIGRNPKTGARVEVPAKKIPYFKPSKELKDVVNNSAALVAYRGQRNFVILNRFPYTNGHVMVVPVDHVSTLGELSDETLTEMML